MPARHSRIMEASDTDPTTTDRTSSLPKDQYGPSALDQQNVPQAPKTQGEHDRRELEQARADWGSSASKNEHECGLAPRYQTLQDPSPPEQASGDRIVPSPRPGEGWGALYHEQGRPTKPTDEGEPGIPTCAERGAQRYDRPDFSGEYSASGQARQQVGNNYNNTTYNYTLRKRRSDETLREDARNIALLRAAAEGQRPGWNIF